MNYSIEWDQKPFKFLQKLERHVVERIIDKLDKVAEDPFRYLEHYEGS